MPFADRIAHLLEHKRRGLTRVARMLFAVFEAARAGELAANGGASGSSS